MGTVALRQLLNQCSQIANIKEYRNGDPSAFHRTDRQLLLELTQDIEEQDEMLRPIMAHLQEMSARSRAQLRINHAFLSPFRRFPREILSEIFLFAAGPGHDDLIRANRFLDHIRKDLSPGHAYNFAQVCHTWRCVALSTAALWTDVRLWADRPNLTQYVLARELPLTRRSPLDVLIAGGMYRSSGWWKAIRQEAYRWRTLCLDRPASGGITEPLSCPSLEKLRVRHVSLDVFSPRASQSTHPKVIRLYTNMSDAPRLRHVDIAFHAREDIEGDLRFPESWRLTALQLQDGIYRTRRPLLSLIAQQASTLEEVDVSASTSGYFEGEPPNSTPLRLPRLRKLTCMGAGYCLMEKIVAPALQTLNVGRNPDGNVTWILERIATFPALTNLSLANVAWESGSLLSTLRNLPQLKSLVVSEDTRERIVTKALLSGLTRGGVDVEGVCTPPNPQCPLPNLVSMRMLLCKSEWSDTYESPLVIPLCMMALSRRHGTAAADGTDLRALETFDARYVYFGVNDAKPILAWGNGK
ncbi:hypothetical protein EV122DRAFT_222622 [Schizophyllum commune]